MLLQHMKVTLAITINIENNIHNLWTGAPTLFLFFLHLKRPIISWCHLECWDCTRSIACPVEIQGRCFEMHLHIADQMDSASAPVALAVRMQLRVQDSSSESLCWHQANTQLWFVSHQTHTLGLMMEPSSALLFRINGWSSVCPCSRDCRGSPGRSGSSASLVCSVMSPVSTLASTDPGLPWKAAIKSPTVKSVSTHWPVARTNWWVLTGTGWLFWYLT